MRFILTKDCYYCERTLGVAIYGTNIILLETVDHVIPISKGGGNEASNLVICCHQCNNVKANHDIVFFLKMIETGMQEEHSHIKQIPSSRFPVIIRNCKILITNNLKSENKQSYGVIIASNKRERLKNSTVKLSSSPLETTLKQAANRLIEKVTGGEYVNYMGKDCPCVGFVDRSIGMGVLQYANAYYHASEEKYVFKVSGGVIAYNKSTIQKWVKPFFPDAKDVKLSVNTNVSVVKKETIDELVNRLLSEPEQNFHYQ